MAVIGYIRVSSNKQTLEHQRFEIEEYARKQGLSIDEWVEEKISSRKALKNRKLGELLENLQENDIVYRRSKTLRCRKTGATVNGSTLWRHPDEPGAEGATYVFV